MKKIIITQFFINLILVLFLNSCAVSVDYNYDYGRKNKPFRYLDLKEKQFTTSVSLSRNREEVHIGGLSKYNAPTWIEDTISTVNFIEEKLSFPDGTILEKKTRPTTPMFLAKCIDKEGNEIPCLTDYYTCDNFKKKYRRYKHLNLKLVYDLDSLGTITRHEKEYELVKKRHYRFAVH